MDRGCFYNEGVNISMEKTNNEMIKMMIGC